MATVYHVDVPNRDGTSRRYYYGKVKLPKGPDEKQKLRSHYFGRELPENAEEILRQMEAIEAAAAKTSQTKIDEQNNGHSK